VIGALIQELRPRQWSKNLLLFAGVLFSQQAGHPELLLRAATGFVTFSLLAGSVYLLNDLRDVEQDRLHPKKRERQIASGRLPVPAAWRRWRCCCSPSGRSRSGSGLSSRSWRRPTSS